MSRRSRCVWLVAVSFLLAACSESDREGTVIETSDDGPVPGATSPGEKGTESAPIDTGAAGERTTPETSPGGGGFEADPEDGRGVFGQAGCGECHTLTTIGSTGTVGPNLDDAEPSYEDALDQITNGGGGMPAYKDQLTEQEISNLAAFVAEATKG